MNWAEYWEQWAKAREADPQLQVARTRFGRPLEEADTERVVNHVTELLGLEPGHRLLDLCCGNGLLTQRLAVYCREVVGMDVSPSMIDSAAARYGAGNIRYVCGPAEKLDELTEGLFDSILIQFSFQYFERQNGAVLLEKMAAKLVPGGRIVLGDVPDRARLRVFYPDWRGRNEISMGAAVAAKRDGEVLVKKEMEWLAHRAGLSMEWLSQPEGLPYAHYRVDVVLRKI